MTDHPARLEAVDTPRGPVGYWRQGGGPPLLLLAGLASTARLWGELPRLLAPRFTVLAPDNRGVGSSRGGDSFTLEGAAQDAAAVVKRADLGPARVLGVSMGGLIACHLAASDPASVSRLIVASCSARVTPYHARVLRFARTLLRRLEPGEAAAAFMTFAFAARFADLYPTLVDQAARLWAPVPEDLPGAQSQLDYLERGYDLAELLPRIAAPTLVLAGSLDAIVPAAETRLLAEAIPGASYREVPGAGHSVLAEGGAELLDGVIDFLAA